MKLYHGSLHKIEIPRFGAGNPRTDYGLGFYCTQDIELAKEWGCSEDSLYLLDLIRQGEGENDARLQRALS